MTATNSPSSPVPRAALGIVFLTVCIDLLGFGMVLPLLPLYAKQFAQGMSPDRVGLVIGLLMSSFSAMQFLFAPLWGRLSDRIGRRPVLLIGLLGSTVFYALFGLSTQWQSLWGLFVTRIGAGVSGATIATAQAYIADVTPLDRRARGMALIGAAFGLGFTFGPLLSATALWLSPDRVAQSPWPGYTAAIFSGIALLLAFAKLPESLQAGSTSAGRIGFDLTSLRRAVAVPSVGLLLAAILIGGISFAGWEATLSLLLRDPQAGFQLEFRQVLYVFAYIGLMLSLAQGVAVRRLATRVPEGILATLGSVTCVVGFLALAMARHHGMLWLLAALAIEVTGFAFVTPSVNGLLSRRTDPTQQGGILGLGQSASALARIIGPLLGNVLFASFGTSTPYWCSAGLMSLSVALIILAARGGRDFGAAAG